MFRVFLVDDDLELNQTLAQALQQEGMRVFSFADGETALSNIHENPHIWVVGIILPGMDGYHLLWRVKEMTPNVPVIFISVRDSDVDRVTGLEMGGDDYLAKPFLATELVLRVKILLARVYPSGSIIDVNPYVIDGNERRVRLGETEIRLTSKEFDLLLLLAQNPGKAVARATIMNEIWGEEYHVTGRSIDDLIRRLRRKMPQLRIETLYGFGYRLVF